MSNRTDRRTHRPSRQNRESARRQPNQQLFPLTIIVICAGFAMLLLIAFVNILGLLRRPSASPSATVTPDDYELVGQFSLSTLVLGPDSAALRYYVDATSFTALREIANRDGFCVLGLSDRGLGDFNNFYVTADHIISLIDAATAEPNCAGFNLIKTFTSNELPKDIRQEQQELAPGKYLIRSFIDPEIANYILSASSNPENEVFGYSVCINDTKLGIIEIPLTAILASIDLFNQGQQQSIIYETPFDLNNPSPDNPANGSLALSSTPAPRLNRRGSFYLIHYQRLPSLLSHTSPYRPPNDSAHTPSPRTKSPPFSHPAPST